MQEYSEKRQKVRMNADNGAIHTLHSCARIPLSAFAADVRVSNLQLRTARRLANAAARKIKTRSEILYNQPQIFTCDRIQSIPR
jgi:hypothetical protein